MAQEIVISARIPQEIANKVTRLQDVAAYCRAVASTLENPDVALKTAESREAMAAGLLATEVRANISYARGDRASIVEQTDRADSMVFSKVRILFAGAGYSSGRHERASVMESAARGAIDDYARAAASEIPPEVTTIPLFDPRGGILAQIGNRLAGSFGINRGTVAVRDFQKRAGNVDAVRDQVVGETIARFQTAARRANASEPDSDEVAAAAQAQIDRAEAQRELVLQVLRERVQNEIAELNAIGDYALSHNLSDAEARAWTTQAEANFAWGSAPGFEKKEEPPPHVSMGNRFWG